jgi:hypothetical protein
VKANNSCARTLIFSFFILLPFVKFFFLPLFYFFDLAFYCRFSFLIWFFIAPCFPFFFALVLYLFFAHVVSSLTYPNLLGNKRLGCCCCCTRRHCSCPLMTHAAPVTVDNYLGRRPGLHCPRSSTTLFSTAPGLAPPRPLLWPPLPRPLA